MKSTILTGAAVFAMASLAQAQVLASDDFTYTGLLTANGWLNHSGSGKFIASNGSIATLDQSGGSGEDASLVIAAQGATDTTYASFDFLVRSADLSLLDSSGLYFAHVKDVATTFRARTGILSSGGGGGDFVLAINADSSNLGLGTPWATELSFDIFYKVVISWDATTNSSNLWVAPVDMSSTSIAHTGTLAAGTLITAFALRQSDDYTGLIDVDNVVVGKTFADVCPPSGPVNYCTSGTSTSGCTANLSTSGTPSATATSGFFLLANDVEGAKDGLYFFGANGRQANGWGNGTSFQCVVPPVKRAGLLTGIGTTGFCDGNFSQDLNLLWNSVPPKNPGAGAVVQAQLWYRDPLNTSNQTTSLSDACEWTMAP